MSCDKKPCCERKLPNYANGDSTPPSKTPTNPNRIVHHIGGIPVEFPYKPYGTQLAFMGRVINTLDRANREGHCHALLESPTGTGKSLSLLCSTLAWQKVQKEKSAKGGLTQTQGKAAPEAVTDPLGHGGGFIPETQETQSTSEKGNLESTQAVPSTANGKKKAAPTIFYASRTHSQITQVIREYKKTSYRVKMAILASRKHYCTNPKVRGKPNLDEECKLLLKGSFDCQEFKNAKDVAKHPSIQIGGCHEVHDIEDLVNIGLLVRGCPYYASRSMAEDAQLVFCPYNYIINPVVRAAMEVDIKGAVIILDEAHNIEDVARDAGSVDLEEEALDQLQAELQQLCDRDAATYLPLYEMIQEIMSWIRGKKDKLEMREFQHYVSCWTGDKALRELEEANITPQCFPVLWQCCTKACKNATELESEEPHLSGKALLTMEGLFASLRYFFSENGRHTFDYQVALRRFIKKETGRGSGYWTHTLSLWCLNPAVVFTDIANLSLSVILTSGTLSPMNSFSSELGVNFGTSLEAPHVIDAEAQIWASVIPVGPGNYSLNASYKTADAYVFQDSLGKAIEEICKVVPGGALIFFPSYKLMEKLQSRWITTGQWSQLNAHKSVFVEPRGGNQDEFEPVLKGYYDAIRHGSKPIFGKHRRMKKFNPCNSSGTVQQENIVIEGAAFLAVCRGKVSEGIDFSDDHARVVIIVGVPFPNINDIQIELKKKYNDTHKSTKNLLSGSQWYCHQAFRALNQAAGRCIRHRLDYGGIIFLDERFMEERNISSISKWLRSSIRKYNNFEKSLEDLKSFFVEAKKKFSNKAAGPQQVSDIKTEETFSHVQSKWVQKIKVEKWDNSNKSVPMKASRKVKTESPETLSEPFASLKKYKAMFSQSKCKEEDTSLEFLKKVKTERHETPSESFSPSKKYKAMISQTMYKEKDTSLPTVKKEKDCSTYPVSMDLECSHRREASKYSPAAPNSPEVTFVKESPASYRSHKQSSPDSLAKDDMSSSTISGTCRKFCDLATQSGENPSASPCSLIVTPDRNTLVQEKNSTFGSSVNSYYQKRRKAVGLQSLKLFQAEESSITDGEILCVDDLVDNAAARVSRGMIRLKDEPTDMDKQSTESCSAQSVPVTAQVPKKEVAINQPQCDVTTILSSFEFKPSPISEGWRSTKSRMRLPKRALISKIED